MSPPLSTSTAPRENGDPTGREIVSRSLGGLETPRAALGPLAVHYCAALAGVSLRDYTL